MNASENFLGKGIPEKKERNEGTGPSFTVSRLDVSDVNELPAALSGDNKVNISILKGSTRLLIADSYMDFGRKHLRKHRHDKREIALRHLVEDEYGTPDRATTLVAVNEQGWIAGTMRIGFGQENEKHFLEMANLIRPTIGNDWKHREEGLDDNEVGEIGRIAVLGTYRKSEQNRTNEILTKLTKEAMNLFEQKGIKKVYTIMPTVHRDKNISEDKPPALLGRFDEMGLDLEIIPHTSIRLLDARALKVFTTFPNYWYKLKPALFMMDVEESLNALNNEKGNSSPSTQIFPEPQE